MINLLKRDLMLTPAYLSAVEQKALSLSGGKLKYEPTEKMGVIIVDHFPALGTLAALRFLEWVQENPGGVISLPTGKTPEFFIKEVRRFLAHWNEDATQDELEQGGINPEKKPELKSLHFVQIDEFYPINPDQHNSFFHYVNKFYLQGFGLDPRKALLINGQRIGIPRGKMLQEIWPEHKVDLSLRFRRPSTQQETIQKRVLEEVDQWCVDYEARIRAMGGIGFFLGGIGPDGHIGFNVRSSDLYSSTRLTPTNYETQAAAAGDLGGIEIARNRLVITVGLSTITYNPDCVAIIVAAGQAKAKIVADAIQQKKHIRFPATALHDLPQARFFITRGAAKHLCQRRLEALARSEQFTEVTIEKIVIDLCLKTNKSLGRLTREDFLKDEFAALVLGKSSEDIADLTARIKQNLVSRIERGLAVRSQQTFLHTEPHHDDIMLGYLPYIVRHIREESNQHHFATLTSGFTAVTNDFMLDLLQRLRSLVGRGHFTDLLEEGYFDPANLNGRNRDIWQYLDGVAARSPNLKNEGQLRRLLRNLIGIYDETDVEHLTKRIDELIHYFRTQYPGKKDLTYIQQLKGMCREWEADCLWGYFGWHAGAVDHLRLGFYKGDIFTEDPTIERDVRPILDCINKIKPDIVSVALDPEASGPDTHYKVLQAITEALRLYEQESGRGDLEILGYRNVWYRFHPSEGNIFVPVSLNMFALQDSAFKNSFISQKDASFPSYEHDGPFSELAQKIQVQQYRMLKTCLGREFFYEHPNALVRATRGMVFLKSMNLQEFYRTSRELKRSTENL